MTKRERNWDGLLRFETVLASCVERDGLTPIEARHALLIAIFSSML